MIERDEKPPASSVEARRAEVEVTFVRVPWDSMTQPSLALGMLVSVLGKAGYRPRVLLANTWLASAMGHARYQAVAAGHGWLLLPEFMFSKQAFPDWFSETTAELLTRLGDRHRMSMLKVLEMEAPEYDAWVSAVRDEIVRAWCERVAEACAKAGVVALSATINQLGAALAAARAIRERNPGVKLVLGGAQVEGEMGDAVLELAPFVDAVYKGEGEPGVVATLDWLAGLVEDPPREWVSYRDGDGELHLATSAAMVTDMDALPTPDYDHYFEEMDRLRREGENYLIFGMPFMSSRGCWWGEKQHCTFCGLNGQGMAYRKMSPERVLDEWRTLSRRHRKLRLVGADNIIPHEYLKTVLPKLRDEGIDYDLFYETKSNLRRADMEVYRDAGMRIVQPGIESLCDNSLEIMRKGVTALQNIYTLKLGLEYDIGIQWNVITGFPGETDEDYEAMATLFKRLQHLEPPFGVSRFVLQRFSPFHFEPEKLGVSNVRAREGYEFLFPQGEVDFERLAFYFDFDYDLPTASREWEVRLHIAANNWRRSWRRQGYFPHLYYARGDGFLMIRDTRAGARERVHYIDGLENEVLRRIDDPVSVKSLEDELGGGVHGALEALDSLGLVVRDRTRVLGLALPRQKGVLDRSRYRQPAEEEPLVHTNGKAAQPRREPVG